MLCSYESKYDETEIPNKEKTKKIERLQLQNIKYKECVCMFNKEKSFKEMVEVCVDKYEEKKSKRDIQEYDVVYVETEAGRMSPHLVLSVLPSKQKREKDQPYAIITQKSGVLFDNDPGAGYVIAEIFEALDQYGKLEGILIGDPKEVNSDLSLYTAEQYRGYLEELKSTAVVRKRKRSA